MWVRLLLLPSLLLWGCTELPDDTSAPSTCDLQLLRVSAVQLPESGGAAQAVGFDLDGDRVIDNQLGALSAALAAIYPAWDPEQWLGDRLAEGEVHWLARVERCGESVRLARAEDADADGRPEILAEGGLVPVGYFADGGGFAADAAWENAPSFELTTRELPGADVELTLGLAVPLGDEALAPAALFLTYELTRGSLFARGIDTDDDGEVSVAELRASPAVSTLLAADIDTDGDGTPDAISIGFTATAEPVEIDPRT
jgi:hypothetical protein